MTGRILWVGIFTGVFVWSALAPTDRFTWWLEVAPAIIGVVILAATWRRFRFTPLVYGLILLHAIVLMVGGHYTYAQVPGFDWLNGLFGEGRNNYDKIGHFAQGFVPAMIAREILIRFNVVNGSGWRFLFIVSFCLALSAFYELIEWWVAIATGSAAEAFLGTQGYAWDTQSDMAMALLGALTALLLLGRWHDWQLARMAS